MAVCMFLGLLNSSLPSQTGSRVKTGSRNQVRTRGPSPITHFFQNHIFQRFHNHKKIVPTSSGIYIQTHDPAEEISHSITLVLDPHRLIASYNAKCAFSPTSKVPTLLKGSVSFKTQSNLLIVDSYTMNKQINYILPVHGM